MASVEECDSAFRALADRLDAADPAKRSNSRPHAVVPAAPTSR